MFGYRDLMVTLALEHGWKTGAILGLGSGTLLLRMLDEVPSVSILGVDHFVRKDRRVRVMDVRRAFPERCTICISKTSQAVSLVEDGAFDFVFVDASRKYGCVRSDVRAWWSKVRVGGWFGGRAYSLEHPGVVSAVNERFGTDVHSHGYSVWSVTKSGEEQ